jgi:hypothetical protein
VVHVSLNVSESSSCWEGISANTSARSRDSYHERCTEEIDCGLKMVDSRRLQKDVRSRLGIPQVSLENDSLTVSSGLTGSPMIEPSLSGLKGAPDLE